MKGLTHFVVGVAAASCFPAAVAAGADGNPLYFLLGGIFGLLPDTLDFRFYRFFYRRDMEVIPDPNAPDPAMIAQALAYAIERSHATRRTVRVKLDTIRLGADRWQQYAVKFDAENRRVTVTYGPEVTTGRRPVGPPPGGRKPLEATAPLACPVAVEYQATTTIDAFDGATFNMVPAPDGPVRLSFIPWHREWTHSLVLAGVFGLAAWALRDGVAGGVVAAAYAAHVLVDQLGFLGSNLFFPFTRERTHGLQRFRSSDAAANFGFVWTALVLTFWNLYRACPIVGHRINVIQAAVFGAVLPLGAAILARKLAVRGRGRRPKAAG